MATRRQPKQPEPSGNKPWLSMLISLVLVGLAIHSQLTTGTIDTPLIAALIILVAFWSGRGIDTVLPKWLER